MIVVTHDIDHVVLAARSEHDAREALDRAGLGVARGRRLPGMGLSNLVVPLGPSLLEVHYPDGSSPAAGAPPLLEIDTAALDAHPATPLVPVAWLVLVEDEDELRRIAARNDAPIMESPADGPGFPPYVLAGFGATFDRPWIPALIHWPVPASQRPAALDADHRRMPSGLSCVEVSGPEDDLRRWCGGLPDGLRVLPGTSGPRRVEVAFADGGTVTFGVDAGAG